MIINNALLVGLYGGVAVASLFILISVRRHVCQEFNRVGWSGIRGNTYFGLMFALLLDATGLFLVGFRRVDDGLHGVRLGGTAPWTLALAMTLLFIARVMFQWAASRGAPPWHWRAFILLAIVWLAVVVWLFVG